MIEYTYVSTTYLDCVVIESCPLGHYGFLIFQILHKLGHPLRSGQASSWSERDMSHNVAEVRRHSWRPVIRPRSNSESKVSAHFVNDDTPAHMAAKRNPIVDSKLFYHAGFVNMYRSAGNLLDEVESIARYVIKLHVELQLNSLHADCFVRKHTTNYINLHKVLYFGEYQYKHQNGGDYSKNRTKDGLLVYTINGL
jgi:hypothetical protein